MIIRIGIVRACITKINKSLNKRPMSVMVAFFDEKGENLGSMLFSAEMFDTNLIREGQEVNFKGMELLTAQSSDMTC